jgi:uncharacterized protein
LNWRLFASEDPTLHPDKELKESISQVIHIYYLCTPCAFLEQGLKNYKVAEHRSAYLIKYTGLPVGDHEFDYEIGDTFFKNHEGSIIVKAAIKAGVILHKSSSSMHLTLKLNGTVWVECVKCLDEIALPVDVEKTLLVRLVEKVNVEDDDIDSISVSTHAHEIDMEPHLYDFLTLQVPYSPVHEDDEDGNPACNPEVLKYISQQPEDGSKSPSERWAALRKLKMN